MSKKIILTADDYGVSNFIDEGIKIALLKKSISTVSTFVCFHDSKERIEALIKFRKKHNLNFGIGLHFSFTSGYSVIPNQSNELHTFKYYINNKKKYYQFEEPNGFTFRNLRDEIIEELKGQLKFLKNCLKEHSIKIDHVSCHHGMVNLDDDLFEMFIHAIKPSKLPIRSPRPWSRAKFAFDLSKKSPLKTVPMIKQGQKLGFAKHVSEADNFKKKEKFMRKHGVDSPDVFNNLIYGQPSVSLINHSIKDFLESKDSNEVEFLFHLGSSDKGYDPHDFNGINEDYFPFREMELDTIVKDMNLYQELQKKNIKVIDFKGNKI